MHYFAHWLPKALNFLLQLLFGGYILCCRDMKLKEALIDGK